jgi:hypothetical protein
VLLGRSQHADGGASIDGGVATTSGRRCYFRGAAMLLPVGGCATSGGRRCCQRESRMLQGFPVIFSGDGEVMLP